MVPTKTASAFSGRTVNTTAKAPMINLITIVRDSFSLLQLPQLMYDKQLKGDTEVQLSDLLFSVKTLGLKCIT